MPWAYFYCLLLRFRLNPGILFLFWVPGLDPLPTATSTIGFTRTSAPQDFR